MSCIFRQKYTYPGDYGMERYLIRQDAFETLFDLIAKVIGKPMTFYDIEWKNPSLPRRKKRRSDYCGLLRCDPDFCRRCLECDRQHMEKAALMKDVHAYVCHGGLLDCVIPIEDAQGRFLGGFIIGQLRRGERQPPPGSSPQSRRLYFKLGKSSLQELTDIGRLVKFLGDYIVANEILRYKTAPWAEAVKRYLAVHESENVSLDELAKAVGHSKSFLSHKFPEEFGMPFKRHQLQVKMQRAKKLLEGGMNVKGTAAKLGFSDEFHFSKSFKAYWRRPPIEYLK
jgi:AraC-like DNA-binding protein